MRAVVFINNTNDVVSQLTYIYCYLLSAFHIALNGLIFARNNLAPRSLGDVLGLLFSRFLIKKGKMVTSPVIWSQSVR